MTRTALGSPHPRPSPRFEHLSPASDRRADVVRSCARAHGRSCWRGRTQRRSLERRSAAHNERPRSQSRGRDPAARSPACPLSSRTTSRPLTSPTTCGSRILAGYTSARSRPRPYRALRDAGAIIIAQDEHGRIRDGLVHRAQRVWSDAESARSASRARRLVRRLGRRRRRRHRSHRARLAKPAARCGSPRRSAASSASSRPMAA